MLGVGRKIGLGIILSILHREGAGIATSPSTNQVCMQLDLQVVVAEVEKLQSAFMHSIDSEDTAVLDKVGMYRKHRNFRWGLIFMGKLSHKN